jgi:arabinan endo-1,5-alpha-L-arabinosidase
MKIIFASICASVALVGCGGNDPAPQGADAPPVDARPAADGHLFDAQVSDASPTDSGTSGPMALNLMGAITPIHDPSIIRAGVTYYVFSTGTGLPIITSIDLVNWSLGGQVFASKPEWITTTEPGNPNNLWAPDISFFGGKYHLYYAASRFGSNVSCIGHATSADIATDPWVDSGGPVICSAKTDNWNAIDPAAFIDESGNAWLAFGSFWGGLKLIRLDIATGARMGTDFIALATRQNTEVEAPYLIHHGGFYYLFESVDLCCTDLLNYKIMVGRSAAIEGPYVDADGNNLLDGGGMLVVQGTARWIAPGHNAILQTASGDYNLYHALDGSKEQPEDSPTLRISQLFWTPDGWPISGGP